MSIYGIGYNRISEVIIHGNGLDYVGYGYMFCPVVICLSQVC